MYMKLTESSSFTQLGAFLIHEINGTEVVHPIMRLLYTRN